MSRMAFNRGVVVGVFMLVVLVLVFALVPGIAANNGDDVGHPFNGPTDNCVMVAANGDLVNLGPEKVEVFRVVTPNPGATAFNDIVALLRCEASFPATEQHALISTSALGVSCHIELDGLDFNFTTTLSWSQTISASGNAVLTCHAKRAAANG